MSEFERAGRSEEGVKRSVLLCCRTLRNSPRLCTRVSSSSSSSSLAVTGHIPRCTQATLSDFKSTRLIRRIQGADIHRSPWGRRFRHRLKLRRVTSSFNPKILIKAPTAKEITGNAKIAGRHLFLFPKTSFISATFQDQSKSTLNRRCARRFPRDGRSCYDASNRDTMQIRLVIKY